MAHFGDAAARAARNTGDLPSATGAGPHQESAMSATLAPASTTATTPRVDLYSAIHKALRLFMNDTLARVGRLDHDDPAEVGATLAQLQSLLEACRSHVAKENKFIHTAIEARCPGASERVGDEHAEHLDAIAALEGEAAALRALPSAGAALRLYRHLARFVGENFEHMHVEESAHNGALWAAYSDTELQGIHQRILASMDPAEMALMLRWMVPAMSPAERAAMLREMQMQMPLEAMRCVLEIVRPHLDDSAWAKLARALCILPVPGLVTQ
jgi:Hemerythrin HHE cation binding domain